LEKFLKKSYRTFLGYFLRELLEDFHKKKERERQRVREKESETTSADIRTDICSDIRAAMCSNNELQGK
jgi:uncharacterized NAD(P)/FAD-binding protein YdhS